METPATRITIEIEVGQDGALGELLIYLNPKGRDWLVEDCGRYPKQTTIFISSAWTGQALR